MRWTFFPYIHLYNLHSTGFHSVRHLNRKIIEYFQNLYAIEERWETNQNHLKNFYRTVEIFLSSFLICQIASGKGKSTGQHYKLHSRVTDSFLFGQRTDKHADAQKSWCRDRKTNSFICWYPQHAPPYKTVQVTGKALDTKHYHAQGYFETAYKTSGILYIFFFYHSSFLDFTYIPFCYQNEGDKLKTKKRTFLHVF